jgi:hypothetical protein
MCPAIDNPASCEICAIICFLHAKNMSAVEIHLELCMVYGQNVMNEGTGYCVIMKFTSEAGPLFVIDGHQKCRPG